MVKIPIFTTEARPTATTPSVKAEVSIPLTSTIPNALKSATQAIVKHRVTEKNLNHCDLFSKQLLRLSINKLDLF